MSEIFWCNVEFIILSNYLLWEQDIVQGIFEKIFELITATFKKVRNVWNINTILVP